MGREPTIDEAFDQPHGQPVGRRIAKNLHIAIPAIVVAIVSVVILFDAADENEQLEEKAQKKAEAEIKQGAQIATDAPEQVLADEIAKQKKAAASQLPPQANLPNSLMQTELPPVPGMPQGSADKLPPVPMGQPQIDEDPEIAKRERTRVEQMRASPVIKLQGNGASAVAASVRGGQLATLGQITGAVGAAQTPEQRIAAMQSAAERSRTEAQARGDELIKLGKAHLAQGRTSGARPVVVGANPTGGNDQWMERVGSGGAAQTVTLEAPVHMPVVHQGTVIPAVLITELNSDLPGQLSAMVTMDVYDSVRGEALIIPKGSRLVGQYNSDLKIGQERAMAAFTRIIRPDGSSMNLGAMSAADGAGQSGLTDQVDSHFWKMFSSSFLIAGISILADKAAPDTVVVNNTTQSPQSSTGEILKDVSRTILERNTRIEPTVIVRKGHRFNVLVNKDITVSPYRH